MFCSNCGNEIKEYSNYCPNCGNTITIVDFIVQEQRNMVDKISYTIEKYEKTYKSIALKGLYNIVIKDKNGIDRKIDCILVCGSTLIVIKTVEDSANYSMVGINSRYWIKEEENNTCKMNSPIIENDANVAALSLLLKNSNISVGVVAYANIVVLPSNSTFNCRNEIDPYIMSTFGGIKPVICTLDTFEQSLEGVLSNICDRVRYMGSTIFSNEDTIQMAANIMKNDLNDPNNPYNILNKYSNNNKTVNNPIYDGYFQYRYYFAKKIFGDDYIGVLLRYNGTYLQNITKQTDSWFESELFKVEGDDIVSEKNDYDIEELYTPEEIINAYNNILR